MDIALRHVDCVSRLLVGGVTLGVTEMALASLQAMGLEGPGRINFEQAEKTIAQLTDVWKKDHV